MQCCTMGFKMSKMEILLIIVSLFFAGNLTADYYEKRKDAFSVYGIAGLVAVFLASTIIWPIWLCRIIWNSIFTDAVK